MSYRGQWGDCIPYDFGALGFGTGEEFSFKGPKGKTGTLVDYGFMSPTVLFTAVTTAATIAIGTASDPDAYGEEFSAGVLGDKAGALTVRGTYNRESEIDDYILNYGHLPADTAIIVTCVAPTGGSPAGTAHPWVLVAWGA